MTIQVTLNANEFQRSGEYKNRNYTSLKIDYISNGRVYFTTIKDNIRWSTMAKQMQLVDGNVIISFGKNDKLIIGTYVDDTKEAEGTPVTEEVSEQTEVINNTEVAEQLEETPVNQINETIKPNNNTFKVSNQLESIMIRGYMSKVEEVEGKRINHPEFDLYLVKSYKYWAIYEKSTGKSISSLMNSKKEAMDKLQEVLNNRYDKFKESINNTIQKDGYISDYKIGSWIRSA